ncbi:MAG: hypothetical protein IIA12_07775 [Proteobacteria bacterium]|nr:hypothetical protein [Pseudomonadota bacterium]
MALQAAIAAATVGTPAAGTTVVFDADFTDRGVVTEPFATFIEKSSNAATVTINRSATGRKSTVVDVPMFLLGTDDYLEIPDDADAALHSGAGVARSPG